MEENSCSDCKWHGFAGSSEECQNKKSEDYGKITDDSWSCPKFEDIED